MSTGLLAGVAGAVVGGLIGGPQGALYGYAIGSGLGSIFFGPKINVKGPRLQDLSIQSSAEGQPIFELYGTMRTAGNVFWGQPIVEHKKKKKSGGKGGGPTTTTYTYTVDFAVGLCEGPITGIVKLWADGKLFYDVSALTAAEEAVVSGGGYVPDATARFQSSFAATINIADTSGTMRLYSGSETQAADPLIEADLGVGNTPAYRGLAYIVFDNFALKDYGNRIPNITAEVIVAGSTSIQRLGVIGPFDTNTMPASLGPDNAKVLVYSHHVRPEKTLAVSVWLNSFATTNFVSADPFYVYSSGITSAGVRGTVAGDQPTQSIAAFCDVPAFFTVAPPGDAALRLYIVQSGAPQLIGTFQPEDQNPGGFVDLDDDRESAVFYVSGQVVVYRASTDKIYSGYPGPGTGIMRTDGALTGLYSGTLRSVFVGQDEIYVLSGSADPYTLTVIDRGTFTVSRTASIPISPTTAGGNQPATRIYSNHTGQVWFYYMNAALAKKLYYLDGTTGRDYGVVPNAPTEPRALFSYSVESGVLCTFSPQIEAITTGSPDYTPALGGAYFWAIEGFTENTVALSTIVSDICASAGLDSSYIDVTGLASTQVRGYIRNDQMTARAALEPLAAGYMFDAVESDGKIVFQHRGGASVATIDYDDLGAASPGAQEDRLVTTITQDNELPIELNMQFVDPARDFQVGTQRSRRQIPASQKIDTINMPISWSATEAKQAAEKLHYTAWEEQTSYQFALPISYLRLEPADVITLPVNGVTRRVRLTKTVLGSVLQCEGVSDYAANYTSESVAAASPIGPQVITVPGTTIMHLLDIPILQDADNDAGLYIAATGTGSGWTGAAIMKSADGVAFEEVEAITTASIIGSASTLLPSGPTTIWDDGSTVGVRLIKDTLASTTDLATMAGANTAAIGAPGRWEIVSFATATLNTDGTYTLSRLLRGRLGTEWAIGTHAIGDAFVLLEAGTLARNVPATTDIGVPRYYKAISFGGAEGDVITYTHQAVGLECYAPTHITGRRNVPSTTDWTIAWVRRTRIDGAWRDYVDAPVGEAVQSYEVDIMSGSTVKRTIAASTQSAAYTAAMQIADFGSTQAAITVQLYQLSATVGRGYAGGATLAASPGATVVLLHFDGADASTTFTDEIGHAFTPAGNAQIDTAQSKFGGSSGFFDGTGDYISTPSSVDFAYGTGAFTWEVWVRFAVTTGNQYIIDHGTNGGSLIYNGGLRYYNSTTGTGSALYTTLPAMSADTWYHVAVARSDGTTRLFIDGVLQASGADAHNYASQTLRIGDYGAGGTALNGWVDEARINKGHAHYTAGFTPPTAPFTG